MDSDQTFNAYYLTRAACALIVSVFILSLIGIIIYKAKCAKDKIEIDSRLLYILCIQYFASIFRLITQYIIPTPTEKSLMETIAIISNILFAIRVLSTYIYFLLIFYTTLQNSVYQPSKQTLYTHTSIMIVSVLAVIVTNIFCSISDIQLFFYLTCSWFFVVHLGILHLIYQFNAKLLELVLIQRQSVYRLELPQHIVATSEEPPKTRQSKKERKAECDAKIAAVPINRRQQALIAVMAKMCIILFWTALMGLSWCIKEVIYFELLSVNPFDLNNMIGTTHALSNIIGGAVFECVLFLTLGMNKIWYQRICSTCDEMRRKAHEKKAQSIILTERYYANKQNKVLDASPMSTPTMTPNNVSMASFDGMTVLDLYY